MDKKDSVEPVRVDRLTVTLEDPSQAFVDGKPLFLDPRSGSLLEVLARNKNRIIDPAELRTLIPASSFGKPADIGQLIFKLRKVIMHATGGPSYIAVVRYAVMEGEGWLVGYALTDLKERMVT